MFTKYPFTVVPDGVGFMVSFPDIPEALTCGGTVEQAIEMADDCLLTALEFYFEDVREVPAPSKARKGQHVIELPASIAVKVELLNEMVRQRVKQAELARRMRISPTQVNRIVNVRQSTKIDTIDAAFQALGKHLDFVVA